MANEAKPKPSFIGRLYNSLPYAQTRIDVFAHKKQVGVIDQPLVELVIKRDDTVVAILTLDDGKELIGLLQEATKCAAAE